MKKFLFLLLSILVLIIPVTSFADAAQPRDVVKSTIDQIIKTNNIYAAADQVDIRRNKLREIINPNFNFQEMSKRALGAHWNSRSEAEQKEFTEIFSDLLAKTYLKRIDDVKTNVVSIDSEKIVKTKALVRTTITHDGQKFPMHYKMLQSTTGWRVYDIVIENIGLVANYRNEFAGIIRKDTFAGLIEKLKKKSAEA